MDIPRLQETVGASVFTTNSLIKEVGPVYPVYPGKVRSRTWFYRIGRIRWFYGIGCVKLVLRNWLYKAGSTELVI